jgi:hypothetical protein
MVTSQALPDRSNGAIAARVVVPDSLTLAARR